MRSPGLMALVACASLALGATALAAPGVRVALGPYSATNTDDAQTNVAVFDLAVVPVAQSFTVDTCDAPTGATYLRIYDENGQQVAAGSSGCPGGVGAKVFVTSTRTQRYEAAAGCVGATACTGRVHAGSNVSVHERWAPVVYQDTDPSELRLRGDYITNFNFDGDYNGLNNWENANPEAAIGMPAHVYYSHVETSTHYFVGFYFFHPQDRTCSQHENDLEGILLAVRKVGLYGELVAMETEAHGAMYQYVTEGLGTTESPAGTAPDGGIVTLPDRTTNPASSTPEFMPYLMAGHPSVYVQPGGHGVWGCGDDDHDANCSDNDGLVYAWQGGNADDPTAGQCDDGASGHYDLLDACGYRLVSLDEWGGSSTVADPAVTQGFWVLQNHICPTCTLHSYTNFNGDEGGGCGSNCSVFTECSVNAANTPWQWKDHAGVGNSDWISDPARLFDIDFEGPEFSGNRFSHDYVKHPYYTHELQVVRSRANVAEIAGVPLAALYVQGSTLPTLDNEGPVITPYHWLKRDPVADSWYLWFYGTAQATGENVWSQSNVNRHFFARQTQVLQQDGSFVNGGRTAVVAARGLLDAGLTEVDAALLTQEIGPGDWTSGSCGVSGCNDGPRADGSCRIQVNDFTCAGGAAGPLANVEFKLTRTRRPSAPPRADAGADHAAECTASSGTMVMLDGRNSNDPDEDQLAYAWSAPGIQFDNATSPTPTGRFPLGQTTVTLALSDGTHDVTDTVIVSVADTAGPSIVLTLRPAILTPPKHQLVRVTALLTVSDACSATTPVPVLISVTSSEPDNGMGDGNTSGDIREASVGTNDTSFLLRAERSGSGSGRTYSVRYDAGDGAGNSTVATGTVTVPIK